MRERKRISITFISDKLNIKFSKRKNKINLIAIAPLFIIMNRLRQSIEFFLFSIINV